MGEEGLNVFGGGGGFFPSLNVSDEFPEVAHYMAVWVPVPAVMGGEISTQE